MSVTSDWVIACQTVLVDRLTGQVSLIHALETAQVQRFPATLPPLQIVAHWHNRTEMATTARLRLELEGEAGDPGATLSEEDVTFAGRIGHRSICIVHALTVQRPGTYRIVARLQVGGGPGWQDGAAWTFVVGTGATAAEA